ncbi:hypothetical protein HII31_07870 [Pseudocercospora fuligena]|uniref:Uncharacterized protein n=1 Tax=Pseudocercospora fuligena TaxID=685502 RepID=A0A8H6RDU4_9PEZI|nr:hypothetical protein HII31_07870 [Pseudocercospora fuligena]
MADALPTAHSHILDSRITSSWQRLDLPAFVLAQLAIHLPSLRSITPARKMPHPGRVVKDTLQGTSSKEQAKMSEPEMNPDAHLLGLSGELRNVIYRLALLEENGILVTQTNHTEPGLLQVCRQIRDEAKTIYRQENGFRLHVINYEPIVPKSAHWIWKKSRFAWRFFGRATGISRSNLKAWMKLFHAGRNVALSEDDVNVESRCVKIAARAARIVARSRRLRWSKVEALLDEFIEGIAAADPAFWG